MRTLPLDSTDITTGDVALLGVPWDDKSSRLRGAAEAPAAVRSYMNSGVSNHSTEALHNLACEDRVIDVGSLAIPTGDAAMDVITNQVDALLSREACVLAIGGDHACAYPLIRAHAAHHRQLTVVQIDAHPDLYDELDGDRFSHACPFARVMEQQLATRLVQVGIRASTPHQQQQAERFGVEVFTMRDDLSELHRDLTGPVYLSLDVDGIDPSMAPAVAHPEAGGLTARQVIDLIQKLPGPIIGADIVELIPARDVNDITIALVWKLVKELAARMLVR